MTYLLVSYKPDDFYLDRSGHRAASFSSDILFKPVSSLEEAFLLAADLDFQHNCQSGYKIEGWQHTLVGPSDDSVFSESYWQDQDPGGVIYDDLLDLPGKEMYDKALAEKEQEKKDKDTKKREEEAQRLVEQQKLAVKQKETEERELLAHLKEKYES